MHGKHGQQAAGADEDEGRVGTKKGGEAELEDGPQERGENGDARVLQPELVEVVDVREAEDDGRVEDGAGDGERG